MVEVVHSLKAGKSPGMDNIPCEMLKNGGETTATVLTAICQKIWKTKVLLKEWTQSLVIPLLKKLERQPGSSDVIVRAIVQSASSAIPVRPCLKLFSTDSRLWLRNCWQKSNQVLDQAGAQYKSSVVESSQRSTYNISTICSTNQLQEGIWQSGMLGCSRSSEASTQRKDWFKPFSHYVRTPAVQSFWTVS